jgi:hypothetical protein
MTFKMTAVLSPSASSPASSPHPSTTSPNPNHNTLPPLVTTPNSQRRPQSGIQRPSAYALNRMSAYSTTSNSSQKFSRPSSFLFTPYHSSLPYAQVRDFAYPLSHPFHYGPPADISAATSGRSTPAIDYGRRLSDPPSNSWNPSRLSWSTNAWGPGEQLPQMTYGGSPHEPDHGPPYSEDEDLQSPVVVSSRAKRSKGGPAEYDKDRGLFTGINGDGSETYYVGDVNEMADGPGGELVTYPPDQARHSMATLNPNSYNHGLVGTPRNTGLSVGSFNESRYSRDYQFTIASPDEEMHGKAVALFDFARENENELPLIEGQVILVSYRHGQGWLVAEDPKSGESGLVPEEYVRLLRDIEGDWSALNNETAQQAEPMDESTDSNDVQDDTMTIETENTSSGHKSQGSNGSNGEKKKPVVSTFSTSSKDLDPYPHPLLGKTEQPPQIVHYGSQASTPTVSSPTVAKRASDKISVSRSSSRRNETR